jgi:hypothetical protein
MGCEVSGSEVTPGPWRPQTYLSAEQPAGHTHREPHRAVEGLAIDPTIAEPSPTAALPVGGDHLAEQHYIALVAVKAVLTEANDQLTVEPGVRIHQRFVSCRNPNLSDSLST